MFLEERFKAMAKDSLNSSHPVSVSAQVTTPEQVSEMFDSITYEKVLQLHYLPLLTLFAFTYNLID